MKAAPPILPARVATARSLILSTGIALRAACQKILANMLPTPTVQSIPTEEILDMSSPRMQQGLKIVADINACQSPIDVKWVSLQIEHYNRLYGNDNPLAVFLRNKAWDICACQYINELKSRQQDTIRQISEIHY